MADSNNVDVATGASDLGQTFNEHAGESGVTPDLDISVGAPAIESDNAPQSLAQSFNDGAHEPDPVPDTSVTATASAEIQTIDNAERALAQHDDRWRELSDRLSNRPVAAPTLDMDGGAQRSVAREYTAYRQEWDAQRDAIEIGAIRDAIDVRANGTTLSNEFTATAQSEHAAPEVSPEPSEPTPEQDNAPHNDGHSRFQREFAVAAPEISRTIDR